MDPQVFWSFAGETERDHLAQVYHLVRQIPSELEPHVKHAILFEILQQHDYRAWPDNYQLAGIEWDLQDSITAACESMPIDHRQRASYMRLLMGSAGRHNDVAYGLSEPLLWRHRSTVVPHLLAMGTRQYTAPVPVAHEMDNGILHVAVSYKHTSTYVLHGTISVQQANAIWTAVRSIPLFNQQTTVRVWVDQNLHRSQLSPGTEWHEFGLLPYACLKTVFVGNGDCSLRLARTRPWLWVGLITAFKSNGIQSKPGYDFVLDSDGVLVPMHNYHLLKTLFMTNGWMMSQSVNVDDVMHFATRMISLWRRHSFMEHAAYEYADDFEKFVNWARRFVIRGVPYSEMKWHHSSDPVRGMDAVVLLRAMPISLGMTAESVLGLARPEILWKVEAGRDDWVLGDLVDRSLVGELPLITLLEVKVAQVGDGEDVTIYGQHTRMERIRFHKARGIVSMELGREDSNFDRIWDIYSKPYVAILNDYKHSATTVTLTTRTSDGALLSYSPFTHRGRLLERGVVVGDASLRPNALPSSTQEDMQLHKIGVCYNTGSCEEVYTMEIDARSWPVSANEATVLLSACNSDLERCRDMVKSLKDFCSYKSMIYRDRSEVDVIHLVRGIRVDEAKSLTDAMFVGGEITRDVEDELVDIIRRRSEKHTLVWVDRVDAERVQLVFRGKYRITRILTAWIGANRELAILEEMDRDKLVNVELTGLVQMAAGMQPNCKVKHYGSGLNPRIQTDEDGLEMQLKGVNGLFCTCGSCGLQVCTLNGLVARVYQSSQLEGNTYIVQWQEIHGCTGHEYHEFTFPNGSRIA